MTRLLARLLLVTVASLLISRAPVTAADRQARILRVFGLYAPCEIIQWSLHLDGGSISGRVKDTRGKQLSFSIASHMRAVPIDIGHSEERMRALMDSVLAIPTELYVGHYQSSPTAEKLEVGSERDKVLIDLLELAAEHELGSRFTSQLDSLWAASNDLSRPEILKELPSRTAMLYRVHLMALGLRDERRRTVDEWDE